MKKKSSKLVIYGQCQYQSRWLHEVYINSHIKKGTSALSFHNIWRNNNVLTVRVHSGHCSFINIERCVFLTDMHTDLVHTYYIHTYIHTWGPHPVSFSEISWSWVEMWRAGHVMHVGDRLLCGHGSRLWCLYGFVSRTQFRHIHPHNITQFCTENSICFIFTWHYVRVVVGHFDQVIHIHGVFADKNFQWINKMTQFNKYICNRCNRCSKMFNFLKFVLHIHGRVVNDFTSCGIWL